LGYLNFFLLIISILYFSSCKEKTNPTDNWYGLMTKIQGNVLIISKDQKERIPEKGSIVLPGESIVAKSKSNADIQLDDGVLIRIKENTVISFTQLFNDRQKTKLTAISLSQGKIFVSIMDKLSPTSNFKVQTKTTVAGVRGTEFLLEENEEGKSTIKVSHGTVALSKISSDKETLISDKEKGVESENSNEFIREELTKEELDELEQEKNTLEALPKSISDQIENMYKSISDQKAQNANSLNEILEKNKSILDEVKSSSKSELNDLKTSNQEELESLKSKNKEESSKIKNSQDTNKEEMKNTKEKDKTNIQDKAGTDLDEIKSKTKIDKSQFKQ
jgi:hypothetical protein